MRTIKIRPAAVLVGLLSLAAKSAESQQRGPRNGLHFHRLGTRKSNGAVQGGGYSRRRLNDDAAAATDGEETIQDENQFVEEIKGMKVHKETAVAEEVEGQNMDMGIGAFAMHNTKSPKASKGGSGGTKSPKASSGTKSPKASSGTKSPKASSGTKSPKASSGTKSPKASSGTKSPKASSGTKSPKASSGTKSPKASSGTKSPKASKGGAVTVSLPATLPLPTTAVP